MDTLLGEGQTGPKILLFLVVVLGLLALAFWLLRRFGGGRLGSSATRGRQPRLAMIDQAAIDNRRRLILIRRDNVEHLLIIGGPTDVVIEQNIVRAAGATLAPGRPATATDTLPRAVPLGEDTMWPLQPEPAPKPDATPRVEPALRTESAPRPQRPPTGVEEPIHWPGESEPPVTAAPDSSPAAPPRERKPRPLDPLAGLAEELSRIPPAPDPGGLEFASASAPRAAALAAGIAGGPHTRCPARTSARRSKSVRNGATAGGRAASFTEVRGQVRWREAWRARCSQAGAGRAGPGGLRAVSRLAAGSRIAPPIPDGRCPRQPVRTENDRRARRARHGRVYARAVAAPVRRNAAPPVPDRRCPPGAPGTARGGRTGRERDARGCAPSSARAGVYRCPGRAGHTRFARRQAGAAEIDVRQSRAGDGEPIESPALEALSDARTAVA